MHEIKAIIRRDRLDKVLDALHQIADVPGITVSTVTGVGRREPSDASGAVEFGEVVMAKLEVVVPSRLLSAALEKIRAAARTGHAGDGKIFVLPVEQSMKIRSGEQGVEAI